MPASHGPDRADAAGPFRPVRPFDEGAPGAQPEGENRLPGIIAIVYILGSAPAQGASCGWRMTGRWRD